MVPWRPEGFFSCCLRWKLSGEAANVTSVTIAASPLNLHRKQQLRNPLAPRVPTWRHWSQNIKKSYLTIYQEISHLKYDSKIWFKNLPPRLRALPDRTSQITCQTHIYHSLLKTVLGNSKSSCLLQPWLPGLGRSAIRWIRNTKSILEGRIADKTRLNFCGFT